jgi:hypothetical protein
MFISTVRSTNSEINRYLTKTRGRACPLCKMRKEGDREKCRPSVLGAEVLESAMARLEAQWRRRRASRHLCGPCNRSRV